MKLMRLKNSIRKKYKFEKKFEITSNIAKSNEKFLREAVLVSNSRNKASKMN